MTRFRHDIPGKIDGIFNTLQSGDRPRSQGIAIHDGSIQLALPSGIKHRATPRIEERGVLEHINRGGDGLQGGAAFASTS